MTAVQSERRDFARCEHRLWITWTISKLGCHYQSSHFETWKEVVLLYDTDSVLF
jgi:hypothetical protein